MSFFCSVVLGEGKPKLVSENNRVALPQSVQSHCVLPKAVAAICFSVLPISQVHLTGSGKRQRHRYKLFYIFTFLILLL